MAERVTDQMVADYRRHRSGPEAQWRLCSAPKQASLCWLVEEGQTCSAMAADFSTTNPHKYRNAGVNVALGTTQISYVEGLLWGAERSQPWIYHLRLQRARRMRAESMCDI
ncbi:hypothetical protein F2981_18990 (plasmid) [Sinorhizobium meliloti]|nr:hypothetical protein [Sinorhizobium meliloti]